MFLGIPRYLSVCATWQINLFFHGPVTTGGFVWKLFFFFFFLCFPNFSYDAVRSLLGLFVTDMFV